LLNHGVLVQWEPFGGNWSDIALVGDYMCYLTPWILFMRNWLLNAMENWSCSESKQREAVISLLG